MFIQALLIGLWAGIAGIDQFNGLTHIHRPIVTGAVVGLILGDFTTGLIAGATLELVWAGMVPLAGAQPPNVVIGGIIGTAFAILSGQAPEVAVGIAVPFAVAGQALITLLFTAYSPIMHKMDTYAMEGDTKSIDRLNYMGPVFLFIFFLCTILRNGLCCSSLPKLTNPCCSYLSSCNCWIRLHGTRKNSKSSYCCSYWY